MRLSIASIWSYFKSIIRVDVAFFLVWQRHTKNTSDGRMVYWMRITWYWYTYQVGSVIWYEQIWKFTCFPIYLASERVYRSSSRFLADATVLWVKFFNIVKCYLFYVLLVTYRMRNIYFLWIYFWIKFIFPRKYALLFWLALFFLSYVQLYFSFLFKFSHKTRSLRKVFELVL